MKITSSKIKATVISSLFLSGTLLSSSQHIAVSPDKNNIFYLGLPNPLTITAENCPCKMLVVKTDNGIIKGNGCNYEFSGGQIGKANITVYKRIGKKLKKLGVNAYRVKSIQSPVFKIGPYSYQTQNIVEKIVLVNQEYVRAEIENFDICEPFPIENFHLEILYRDSCKVKQFFNETNKLSEDVRNAFTFLKKDDIIIFNKIFARGADGSQQKLASLILTIGE